MNALTLAELKRHQADLAWKAEKLRQEWRAAISTSPRALTLGRQVKAMQSRADDYARLLTAAEQNLEVPS